MLFRTGLYPSVILPPSGKDPDDWVREKGIETVKASIEDPLDYCSFHLMHIRDFSYFKCYE